MKCRHCNGTGEEIDHKKMGAGMRKARERANLSLKWAAHGMGISSAYLSDLERGNRAWDANLIAKFEKVI